jgi:excisionase family DNA binding protein
MPITVTLNQAVQESGLSLGTLYRAIRCGELESVTAGGRRLIPVKALRAYLLGSKASKPVKRRVPSERDIAASMPGGFPQ